MTNTKKMEIKNASQGDILFAASRAMYEHGLKIFIYFAGNRGDGFTEIIPYKSLDNELILLSDDDSVRLACLISEVNGDAEIKVNGVSLIGPVEG